MSQFRGLLRINPQVSPTPRLRKFNWPYCGDCQALFGLFSCHWKNAILQRGRPWEAAAVDCSIGSTPQLHFCLHPTSQPNHAERENKLRFGTCWIVCWCFRIDLAFSFYQLKTFAKQPKIHAKGRALTESSSEFVFWAASSAARSTNFNPCLFSLSSHSLRNQSSYYIYASLPHSQSHPWN